MSSDLMSTIFSRHPLPPALAQSVEKLGPGRGFDSILYSEEAHAAGLHQQLVNWMNTVANQEGERLDDLEFWKKLPVEIQSLAMKAAGNQLPMNVLFELFGSDTPQVRWWAAVHVADLDDVRLRLADDDYMNLHRDGIGMNREQGIRAQVFEVIVRQAIAGAPWRVICAGPMSVNGITEEEVAIEVFRRSRGSVWDHRMPRITPEPERRGFIETWPSPPERVPMSIAKYTEMWRAIADRLVEAQTWSNEASAKEAWMAPNTVLGARLLSDAVVRSCINSTTQESRSSALERSRANLTSTTTDRDAAERVLLNWYKVWKAPPPKVVRWLPSPRALHQELQALQFTHGDLVAPLMLSLRRAVAGISIRPVVDDRVSIGLVRALNPNPMTFEAPLEIVGSGSRGQLDLSLMTTLSALRAGEAFPFCQIILDAAQHCGCWWAFKDQLFITPKPAQVHLDDQLRFHSANGPALVYEDWQAYFWHDALIPGWIVEHPEGITVAKITAEQNVELRRVMLEKFGPARYLRESGAQILHKSEKGTLYKIDMTNDEPLVMVRVKNSTAEPDGTFKDYYLRVPPHIFNVEDAIAWTFNMSAKQYAPNVET